MTITIRDVARHLNLSITTVSRALDGYSDVAEETRELVVRTAREMGYAPNRAARQLRRRRSDTIGYILPSGDPRFAEAFFSEFIAGLGDEAARMHFDLLVSTASPGEDEQQVYPRWVQGRKVDGLILNRVRLNDWRVQYLARQKFPFVALERSLDHASYAFIEVDGRAGLQALLAHLVAAGHRHIAYIGGPADLKIQADRFAGYCAGLAAAGISLDNQQIANENATRQDGYLAAQVILASPNPPTAIVCYNDLTAVGALQAAHERGLAVGKDLAVAGFDGTEEARHTRPPLTTLAQPVYEVARRLVQMLIAQVNGQPLAESRVCLVPELILRESTGD